jgi:hypothetical protein
MKAGGRPSFFFGMNSSGTEQDEAARDAEAFQIAD